MHWIWANRVNADDQALVYGTPAAIEADDDLSFEEGNRVTRKVPAVTVELDKDSQGKLTDNLIAGGVRGLLFNARLRDVFTSLGVDNLQYFPCHLRNLVTRASSDDYEIANIIGRVECVDFGKSEVTRFRRNPSQLMLIEKLALDAKKARGHDLFRLHEQPQIIVVSERVKRACEKKKITGVVFFAPEDFIF